MIGESFGALVCNTALLLLLVYVYDLLNAFHWVSRAWIRQVITGLAIERHLRPRHRNGVASASQELPWTRSVDGGLRPPDGVVAPHCPARTGPGVRV